MEWLKLVFLLGGGEVVIMIEGGWTLRDQEGEKGGGERRESPLCML